MAEVDRLFDELIKEAVAVCGADTLAATAHVKARMGQLSLEQQEALSRMMQQVIGFREPDKPFREN